MNQIFDNKYIKSFKFASSRELSTFVSNLHTQTIPLDETYGDNYFCYVCYDSLTKEPLFIISFCSDEKEENLNLLVWSEWQLLVVDTGRNLHFIDNKLNLKTSFEITTPLIGLHLTKANNLLILEEASFRLTNSAGKVLKSALFDLIESFNINDDQLSVLTSEEIKTFKLM